jgi:hypothetical protein
MLIYVPIMTTMSAAGTFGANFLRRNNNRIELIPINALAGCNEGSFSRVSRKT